MSKLVSDLLNEFHSIEAIEDDFSVFIMSIVIDDEGEVESTASIEPINKIMIDNENQECLFQSTTSDKAMSISKTMTEVRTVNPEYALCLTEEKTIDGDSVRIDNPIIGFGENIEQRKFFIVCQSF